MTDGRSTALLTDHYELTMLDAALRSNTAAMPVTFEVFARRLPPGRRVGVFAGLGRLLDALEEFHFGPDQLRWLADVGVVSAATIDWLRDFRFHGSIDAYAEGEWYTQGSPVLTVEGTFAETVLLETLVLSILNHDSAIAAAASLLAGAAGERPLIEMGSRRTDPDAAVAAARAAYLSGFASTSNLEAGRRYTIPTAGTAAHAFVLVHRAEREAFAAQVAALGADTTLLVDTFDTEAGIRTAVEVAGPTLGAVRIDSGDPATTVPRARHLLDSLGASATKIIVTGDLDERVIGVLSTVPADGYGVGTNLVTGLGAPTAGFVYKLVAVANDAGGQHPVAKLSPGKATVGGRKWAWRARQTLAPGDYESPVAPLDVSVGSADEGTGDDDRGRVGARHRGAPTARGARAVLGDVVALSADGAEPTWRALQRRVVERGRIVERTDLAEARAWHVAVRAERDPDEPLVLIRR